MIIFNQSFPFIPNLKLKFTFLVINVVTPYPSCAWNAPTCPQCLFGKHLSRHATGSLASFLVLVMTSSFTNSIRNYYVPCSAVLPFCGCRNRLLSFRMTPNQGKLSCQALQPAAKNQKTDVMGEKHFCQRVF